MVNIKEWCKAKWVQRQDNKPITIRAGDQIVWAFTVQDHSGQIRSLDQLKVFCKEAGITIFSNRYGELFLTFPNKMLFTWFMIGEWGFIVDNLEFSVDRWAPLR